MQSPKIPGLLAALDRAVFAERDDQGFEAVDRLPAWCLDFLNGDDPAAIPLAERFLFLPTFLDEAREHWDREAPGTLRSGSWTEADPQGVERRMQASALFHGERRLLIIELLGAEYDELHAVLQKARETMLSYQRLGRLASAMWQADKATRAALRAAPDSIFRLRTDGTFIDFAGSPSKRRKLAEFLPPEVADALSDRLMQVVREQRAVTFEYTVEGRSFEAGFVRLGDDEAFAVIRDVTARKREERELHERLERLRSRRDVLALTLDELGIGALLADEQGRCTWAAATASALLGLEGDALRGQPWVDIAAKPADRRRLLEMAAKPAEERERLPIEAIGPQPGPRLEVDIRNDPLRPHRHLIFLHDVSEVVQLRKLLEERVEMEGIVGATPPMQEVFHLIEDFSQFDSTVLIEGETGSGKELVARALHTRSVRSGGPFVAINCAGLTESLVASQLFGHKRGSFTGAVQDQKGVFEAADQGTLFLDEIGDVPMTVQTSLLRALQEREITRVGDVRPRKVDVRVVAATHRDLNQAVEAGTFRADLLYRIRVARIPLPPLRERREDIALLADRFLEEFRAITGRPVKSIARDAMRKMTDYPWPGNVRELRSAIEIAVIRCRSGVIEVDDLPPEVAAAKPAAPETPEDELRRYREALSEADGNRTQAAKIVGVSRSTFYRRLEQLGLADEFPAGEDARN